MIIYIIVFGRYGDVCERGVTLCDIYVVVFYTYLVVCRRYVVLCGSIWYIFCCMW